ncbi:MAG: M48 family metallopeptidase [Planctomycetes bacterium]|nr:M48 family metallopeptidase [Planctomycetota bacterium]
MDLFQQIASNKRRSTALLILLLVLLAAFLGVLGGAYGSWEAGVAIAVVVGVVAFLVAWFGGSAILLTISGAKEIQRTDHPQLWNVVEEMKIASGLPRMPRVYLIEDGQPNAFATGRDPEHAAVAITTGLLEKLDRDELQGVMAHEIGHVRNFDIRYAMLVGVLVGAIALVSDLFLRSLRFSGRRSRGGGKGNQAQAILMVIAIVFALVAPIAALALRMAISRQREYLADASAAEFTRNPAALARALQKIAGDPEPLEVANRATQHLYIANPLRLGGDRGSLFATHPPIQDRVKRLLEMAYEPRFQRAAEIAGGAS